MMLACAIRSSASSISSIDVSTGPIDCLRPSIIDPLSLDWSESICEFIDAKRTSVLMRKRCITEVYANVFRTMPKSLGHINLFHKKMVALL